MTGVLEGRELGGTGGEMGPGRFARGLGALVWRWGEEGSWHIRYTELAQQR